MAAGQKVFGHPWYGVWLSCGLLAGALCWALQGWLPPVWALAGSLLSLQLCFFSYWMNSYWGGAMPAIGGALVIGAWPRIARCPASAGWALGAGAIVLELSRPYEGLLLLLPVLIALAFRNRDLRVWVPIAVCGSLGAAWLAYYDYRVTGNALRLPYHAYFLQYETVPQFNILPLATADRILRHADFEWIDKGWLLTQYRNARSIRFPLERLHDWYITLKTILGGTLPVMLLLFSALRLFRSPRRMRFLLFLTAVIMAGTLIEVGQYPHYAAPFAAVLLILTAEALRRTGALAPLFCSAMLLYTGVTDGREIFRRITPDRFGSANRTKGEIEARLVRSSPGRHVIFVRYTAVKIPHEEWIYNAADIDGAPVVWAQDMGDAENRRLMSYFRSRAFWRFQPDDSPELLVPYP